MQQPSETTQNTNNADVPQAVEHKVVSGDFSVLLQNVVSNPGICFYNLFLEIFPDMIKQYKKSRSSVDLFKLMNIYLKNFDELKAVVTKQDNSKDLPVEDELFSYVVGQGIFDLSII